MKILNKVLDYIFLPSCCICNKVGEKYICEECEEKLKSFMNVNSKEELKNNRFHLLKYEGIIREKMIQYKFNDKPYMYNMFTELLLKNKKACEFISEYDIIVPVPIHSKRKRERGYNQSELIAKKIAEKLGILLEKKVLLKQKNTKPQSLMNREDRISNISGAYYVENATKVLNKNVIILDDIYTTGATCNECKKILKQAGANKIGIITIAKD